MENTGAGTLKCVCAWSPRRRLRDTLEQALVSRVAAHNVRHLHGDTFIVFTDEDTPTVRGWLSPLLEDGESLLVVEFERWSGHGDAIDRSWLLRRGH